MRQAQPITYFKFIYYNMYTGRHAAGAGNRGATPIAGNLARIDRHIGRRLRQLREARGVSQSELGRRIGATVRQMQRYERGESRLDPARLFTIAHVLGTKVTDFFEGL